jgi:hypothetical protein
MIEEEIKAAHAAYNAAVDAAVERMLSVRKEEVDAAMAEREGKPKSPPPGPRPYATTDGRVITITPFATSLGDILANIKIK